MRIHIAITQRVRAESVGQFEEALNQFARRSLKASGAINMYCLRPPTGSDSREYGIMRSFADEADRAAFYQSALYQEWLVTIAPMIEIPATFQKLDGMEAWFRESPADMPPRWKMAIISWIGVWPLSMLVPVVLVALFGPNIPPVWMAAATAGGIVGLLTWVAMPLLARLFAAWLKPSNH